LLKDDSVFLFRKINLEVNYLLGHGNGMRGVRGRSLFLGLLSKKGRENAFEYGNNIALKRPPARVICREKITAYNFCVEFLNDVFYEAFLNTPRSKQFYKGAVIFFVEFFGAVSLLHCV